MLSCVKLQYVLTKHVLKMKSCIRELIIITIWKKITLRVCVYSYHSINISKTMFMISLPQFWYSDDKPVTCDVC